MHRQFLKQSQSFAYNAHITKITLEQNVLLALQMSL